MLALPPLLDLFGEPLLRPVRRRAGARRSGVERSSLQNGGRPSVPVAPDRPAPSPVEPATEEPPGESSPSLSTLLQQHPQVWRGTAMGRQEARCWPSGHALLDAELPGGGWPSRALTELLIAPRPGHVEWRLLAPALSRILQGGRRVLLIHPPHEPHVQGLTAWGLTARDCIWIRAVDPLQRQWALEQALRADADEVGAVLAWLQSPRPAALRRLQTLAAGCRAPLFVCHAAAGAAGHSAAPLRLRVQPAPYWAQLQVEVIKRRGPPLDHPLWLQAPPPSLRAVLPLPELRAPAARAAAVLQG